MQESLEARCGDLVELLHDRRIPGRRSNIDHLAVSPSGIWVIDSKRYAGRARVRRRLRGEDELLDRRAQPDQAARRTRSPGGGRQVRGRPGGASSRGALLHRNGLAAGPHARGPRLPASLAEAAGETHAAERATRLRPASRSRRHPRCQRFPPASALRRGLGRRDAPRDLEDVLRHRLVSRQVKATGRSPS